MVYLFMGANNVKGKGCDDMARGINLNSLKALEENRANTQFCGESAVKAAKKKHENEIIMKSLCDDLRERCTEERIAKMNESIITRAEHGDLNAYKLIRDGLGESPSKKLVGNGQIEYILSWGDGPESEKNMPQYYEAD